jgi:hypothetical protein
MLLINKVDSHFDEETGDDILLEDPITRFKKLCGPYSPDEAKAQDENLLRAKYGEDVIRNGFYCSDNAAAANKERDIFKFSIPEKIPEFTYERNKVTLDDVFKFIFPPNLEHSNTSGRLDMFALYGPTVAYHSVDKCFCKVCVKIAKGRL